MTAETLKCIDCKVAAETVSDPQDDDMVTCPQCGASETYENVISLIGEQAKYESGKMLQDSLKGLSRRSKIIRHKPANLHKPKAQFVIDMKF